VSEAFNIIGDVHSNGVVIVGDHASNFIPDDIVFALDDAQRESHIAWDIGVSGVANILVSQNGYIAILAGVSRLVVDLNRYPGEEAVVPCASDGVSLHANQISAIERADRLRRYYYPYHTALADLIHQTSPKLLLSVHSFTPQLSSKPNEQRPWEISVLYNQDERAARIAIPAFKAAGFIVGDQLPYSGKQLNATMNRHGEGNNIPYLGIEMRQDLVGDAHGQARFASLLAETCQEITETLGVAP
jgi:predicted N-formylglutamate amidohydrolase